MLSTYMYLWSNKTFFIVIHCHYMTNRDLLNTCKKKIKSGGQWGSF